jgi:peptidoglycan/xylan/chitin deacetylase (PgdA/CDA1 family)
MHADKVAVAHDANLGFRRSSPIDTPDVKAPFAKRMKSKLGHLAVSTGLFARGPRSKMTIIAFHRVNDELPEDGLTYGSAKFREFCEFFRDNFNVIPLSEQVAGCNAGKDMGSTLSITFDDGYLDNYEVAAPILSKLGLPATFFVTSGFIGTDLVAPWDRLLPMQPGWMDWNQVRSLASQGFEIGGHTDTHIDLGTSDEHTVRAELEVSKQKLREHVGVPVRLFAYPFGGQNNITHRTRELVREAGFTCCVSCFGGLNAATTTTPFELKRVPLGIGQVTADQFGFDFLIGRV